MIAACPECEQGKHDNCDGTSWDTDRDREAECPCSQSHPVTVTLPRGDIELAVHDIYTSHGDRCIPRDNCDCIERAQRMSKALERP